MRYPVIEVMAAKEMRDAARSRWLAGFIAAFLVLGGALMLVGSMSSAFGGSAGFGRTTAALVNLVLLVVPLMGLTAGALAFSLERERGTLEGLLALPVRADELFWAKFSGLAVALSAAVALSFGLLGLGLAARGGLGHAAAYAGCLAATLLLALIALALGLLLSVLARRVATALGWALLLWLALVFAGDLGLLGTSLAVRLRPGVLLAAAWLNPLSLYRLLAIDATAAGLEMLGPAGRCAQDILGSWLRPAALAGLLAWLGAALAAALVLFRRDPIGRGT
ncbi:MAG: ABC transporter permease subunit [Elusimicrobia bacterium]|nr:ABC transporter permease subunit [Elusimicrobiota bacterium]